MIRLLGWLGVLTPIWLTDFEGDVYLTVLRKHPSPKWAGWARVYQWSATGYVLLKHDGTCERDIREGGVTAYMRTWTTEPIGSKLQRLHRLTSA